MRSDSIKKYKQHGYLEETRRFVLGATEQAALRQLFIYPLVEMGAGLLPLPLPFPTKQPDTLSAATINVTASVIFFMRTHPWGCALNYRMERRG
jgi:hypothetical protein